MNIVKVYHPYHPRQAFHPYHPVQVQLPDRLVPEEPIANHGDKKLAQKQNINVEENHERT